MICRGEKVSKQIFVTPLSSGEINLQPVAYTFSLDGEELSGSSSDKPASVEVLTKREYILSSSWHSVSLTYLKHV
jgi:hypothetical protein